MRAKGFYFDGLSSRQHAAELWLDAQGNWCLQAGDQLHCHAAAEVEVSPRLGNTRRIVHFADGAYFSTDQHETLDLMLRQLRGNRHGWLHRLESSWKWVLASCAALLLALYLGLTVGAPLLARGIVVLLPPAIDVHVGQQTMDLLDSHILQPSQLPAKRQQELLVHFSPLLSDHPELALQVHFRRLPGAGANAFALPGGNLVLLDDMVRLAREDDELSAVLAHEIGHVAQRHGMRRVVQNGLLYWGLMAITGDISAASDSLASAPAFLMNMAYSRAMENEADDFARRQMDRHGIAPVHFANIMRRIDPAPSAATDRKTRLLHILSSHPDTAERVHKFEE